VLVNSLCVSWRPCRQTSDMLKFGRRHTDAWQLVPCLGNQPGDTYIPEKNTYDAFQNTRLESLLRYWGVNMLIIGGVATNVCCETTARCVYRQRVQQIPQMPCCPLSKQLLIVDSVKFASQSLAC